jgi:hypothetical protein
VSVLKAKQKIKNIEFFFFIIDSGVFEEKWKGRVANLKA